MELVREAIDDITTAALIGEGWEQALQRFAHGAGAQGAVLMRNRPGRMITAITTEEVAEAVRDFAAGRAPPSSRYQRVRIGGDRDCDGFRTDLDDYDQDQLDHDPFYQEFLRPRGFFWHANAALTKNDGEWVELSLKRSLRAEPYQRDDMVLLDRVLPDLRAATRLASSALDAGTASVARLLRRRGDPLYQIDAMGRVLSTETLDDADAVQALSVSGRKLVAADKSLQPALDRAVAMAVRNQTRSALVPLARGNGRRAFLQIVAVPGRARDIFHAAAAIAVVIDTRRPGPGRRPDVAAVGRALGLTDREADVACLLVEGVTPDSAAAALSMKVTTLRVHLRSIFEKTGTRRQAELVALMARLTW